MGKEGERGRGRDLMVKRYGERGTRKEGSKIGKGKRDIGGGVRGD